MAADKKDQIILKFKDMRVYESDRCLALNMAEEGDPAEDFTIMAELPKDTTIISQSIARRQLGISDAAFSQKDLYRFERDCTINQLVKLSPEWWGSADDCPMEEYLDKLYEKIKDWTKEFQENLKKNKYTKRGAEE